MNKEGKDNMATTPQKLTLYVPQNVVTLAKIAAIKKGTSLSSAVSDFLREFAKEDDQAEQSAEQMKQ